MDKLRRINSQADLITLAFELGVGPDWHEPNNQSVDAFVFGANFDNAGSWGIEHVITKERETFTHLHDAGDNTGEWIIENPERFIEMFVVLYRGGKAVAEVNLATLFAFACGTYEGR